MFGPTITDKVPINLGLERISFARPKYTPNDIGTLYQ
uniref:Uncharacterized protein n=1 Tax=Arundo donax TaxID=35708 RepID=A0A0A9EGA7_ARUDO